MAVTLGLGAFAPRSHLFCYVPSWLVEVTFPLGAEDDTCLGPPPRHERTRIKAEDRRVSRPRGNASENGLGMPGSGDTNL